MTMFKKSNRQNAGYVDGQTLVQEYISALNSRVLVESMKYEAENNEQLALNSIVNAGTHHSMYTTLQDVPAYQQSDITKYSVNAHIQKAQALQAEAYNREQLINTNKTLNELYCGRRLMLNTLSKNMKPVVCYWDDNVSGTQKLSEIGPRKLVGIIDKIDVSANVLIIRPTLRARTLNRSLRFYEVYVIDPKNMQPLVNLRIS